MFAFKNAAAEANFRAWFRNAYGRSPDKLTPGDPAYSEAVGAACMANWLQQPEPKKWHESVADVVALARWLTDDCEMFDGAGDAWELVTLVLSDPKKWTTEWEHMQSGLRPDQWCGEEPKCCAVCEHHGNHEPEVDPPFTRRELREREQADDPCPRHGPV